jgi:hypothetical protein
MSSVPPPVSLMPTLDPGKQGARTLPQPMNFPVGTPRTSPLDVRPLPGVASMTGTSLPPISVPPNLPDAQRTSNWPALLRATELAREADIKGTDIHPDREETP